MLMEKTSCVAGHDENFLMLKLQKLIYMNGTHFNNSSRQQWLKFGKKCTKSNLKWPNNGCCIGYAIMHAKHFFWAYIFGFTVWMWTNVNTEQRPPTVRFLSKNFDGFLFALNELWLLQLSVAAQFFRSFFHVCVDFSICVLDFINYSSVHGLSMRNLNHIFGSLNANNRREKLNFTFFIIPSTGSAEK